MLASHRRTVPFSPPETICRPSLLYPHTEDSALMPSHRFTRGLAGAGVPLAYDAVLSAGNDQATVWGPASA